MGSSSYWLGHILSQMVSQEMTAKCYTFNIIILAMAKKKKKGNEKTFFRYHLRREGVSTSRIFFRCAINLQFHLNCCLVCRKIRCPCSLDRCNTGFHLCRIRTLIHKYSGLVCRKTHKNARGRQLNVQRWRITRTTCTLIDCFLVCIMLTCNVIILLSGSHNCQCEE